MNGEALEPGSPAGRRVLKNASFLLVAQVASTPISLLVNAVMARSFGAADFGVLFLLNSVCGFAFLLVDWGQSTLLAAEVAQRRTHAGLLLGSALGFRALGSLAAFALLLLLASLLDFGSDVRVELALLVLVYAFGSFAAAGQDAIRGLERTDFAALSAVGWQLLSALVSLPVLWFGGKLRALILGQLACSVLGWLVVLRATRAFGLRPLRCEAAALKALARQGTPFVLFGIALALQPNVDALFLSRFASAEAIGWHAVTRKLLGVLIYPANALLVALYPTLSRLYAQDRQAFVTLSAKALANTSLLALPAALGCFLYPELGLLIFGSERFGAAADNLRISAAYLGLLYLSMPLSSCLMASGRQRVWAFVQLACVLVSALLDPILVPWFEAHSKNGGLGVCVASVVSEACMLGIGLWLAPRGLLGYGLLRRMALASLAGAAMLGTARLSAALSPWLSAPLASIAYFLVLLVTGAIDVEQRTAVVRSLGRLRWRFAPR